MEGGYVPSGDSNGSQSTHVATYFVIWCNAAILSFVVTGLLIRLSPWIGAVDRPGLRKVHTEPTPRIGGLAIAAAMIASVLPTVVLNNVIGTLNALEYCDEFEVDEFVLISTDKAVTPTSVMGASKRVAEFLTQSFAGQTETRCITVRFGNVIGSNGSVVPLFQKQIALGGPVTVTDPNMRRYFMTIPEAVQLITQAASMGNGGDVLILDMGEPVRVMDMAEQLITLSGFRPGEDIEIEIIGLRPGEKLEEALWHEWEKPSQTGHSKILAAHSEPRDWQQIMADVERLRVAATEMDPNRVVALLQEVIPDYTPMGRIGTRQAATAPDPSAQRSATNPSI